MISPCIYCGRDAANADEHENCFQSAVLTDELQRAEGCFQEAFALSERARAERNALIHAAIEAGWSHFRIAEATGLTRSRVGQIALRS
jgi:hypothetical protein